MTSKAIFYYTKTGKTEEAIDKVSLSQCKLIKLNEIPQSDVNFHKHDILIIGTPTYGRGVPPLYFKDLVPQILSLEGKKIGLFGSGNTIYGDDFCGALDLIEDLVKENNEVIFKYKFEGMPRKKDIDTITKLILEA